MVIFWIKITTYKLPPINAIPSGPAFPKLYRRLFRTFTENPSPLVYGLIHIDKFSINLNYIQVFPAGPAQSIGQTETAIDQAASRCLNRSEK
jgi:hypothetical protein